MKPETSRAESMMSLIDWSDPEEMLGLLMDYVADEAKSSHADRPRLHFLVALFEDVDDVFGRMDRSVAQALLDIRNSQPEEFASDPVIAHLDACIEELRSDLPGEAWQSPEDPVPRTHLSPHPASLRSAPLSLRRGESRAYGDSPLPRERGWRAPASRGEGSVEYRCPNAEQYCGTEVKLKANGQT